MIAVRTDGQTNAANISALPSGPLKPYRGKLPVGRTNTGSRRTATITCNTERRHAQQRVKDVLLFHKLYEPTSTLSRNFPPAAPNIIALDWLCADFDGLRIFFVDPR